MPCPPRFTPRVLTLLLFVAPLLSQLGIAACQQQDADGDGWTTEEGDCDDADPRTYPGAPEVCDDRDNDCDGKIDEGVLPAWYADLDADGHGAGTALKTCDPPAHFVTSADDCNDADASVFPGAVEQCDQKDNDCDQRVDETFAAAYYPDGDGDGFGSTAHGVPCALGPDYRLARGDCDDASDTVYPGAVDPAGDGVDRDCGGSDAPEPHVGFADSYASVQAAIDAAPDGATVWVGPGSYLEQGLTFRGRPLTLASTHQADVTVLDGEKLETIVRFDGAEGATSVLDGFALTNGPTTRAALIVEGAGPTLKGLVVAMNGGPGADMIDAEVTLSGCTFRENGGHGLRLTGGSLLLEDFDASENRGSGLYLEDAVVSLRGGTIASNRAASTLTDVNGAKYAHAYGGGIYAVRSSLALSDVQLLANQARTLIDWYETEETGGLCYATAETYSKGGGLFLQQSTATLTRCHLEDNLAAAETKAGARVVASSRGGAIALLDSDLVLTDTTFTANAADGNAYLCNNAGTVGADVFGGALYSLRSSLTLERGRLTGNAARATSSYDVVSRSGGGGLALDASSLILRDSLLQANLAESDTSGADQAHGRAWGGGLYLADSEGELTGNAFEDNGARSGITAYCCSYAAGYGGGAAFLRSHPTVLGCRFTGNQALGSAPYEANSYGGFGGGLYLEDAAPRLEQLHIADNRAEDSFTGSWYVNSAPRSAGGGLSLVRSSPVLNHVRIERNTVTGMGCAELLKAGDSSCASGGGMALSGSSPQLTHVLFAGNTALADGGGLWIEGSSPTIRQGVMSGGTARRGGGLYAVGASSRPVIENSILAYNTAPDLYSSSDTSGSPTLSLYHCALYNPAGASHNLGPLDSSNQIIEPGFFDYQDGLPIDFHLALSSPLVDMGDPAVQDADGSRSDMGIYGGPAGARWDLDGDGVPAWFWPGTIEDAPAGYDPALFDCDDLDPARRRCD